jgi:peroxiredoxin
MKKLAGFIIVMIVLISTGYSQKGYKIGDKAYNFSLKNVDGKNVSLNDYTNKKGVVVVFTCNHCPFAKAYENRIIEIHNQFASKGFPVIAINPNDSTNYPEDSFSNMQERAAEKKYPFPYLLDADQDVYPKYGATKTPHIFLLEKKGNDFYVAYIGAIDDNSYHPDQVREKYLANAISSVISGEKPNPQVTKAVGCTIKKRP